MPTAARLVAALVLAIGGAITAQVYVSYYPELKSDALAIVEVTAAMGALIGWSSLGTRAGDGVSAAVGYGLRSAAHTAAWVIMILALYHVFDRIAVHTYQEPMDAVEAVFKRSIQYFGMAFKFGVVAAAAVLGIIAGVLMELSSRVWT